jgi:hypothetical protein
MNLREVERRIERLEAKAAPLPDAATRRVLQYNRRMLLETTTRADHELAWTESESFLYQLLIDSATAVVLRRHRDGQAPRARRPQDLCQAILSYPPDQDPPEEYRQRLEAWAAQPHGTDERALAGILLVGLERHELVLRAKVAQAVSKERESGR